MSPIQQRSACRKPTFMRQSTFTKASCGDSSLPDGTIFMEKKIEVGVLGATGMVGQHFVKFLRSHPWFELTWVGASDRSAGKLYKEATAWRLEGDLPAKIAELPVYTCEPKKGAPKIVFSATDASVATEIEQSFAQAGHVV